MLCCFVSSCYRDNAEPDGTVTVLADRYAGQRLNSPNDVVMRSDGMIFFTDPPFGLGPGETGKECSYNGVYRLQPDGDVICLVEDFDRPTAWPSRRMSARSTSTTRRATAFAPLPSTTTERSVTAAGLPRCGLRNGAALTA